MKLAFIGTGKIIADAMYAITPLKNIEYTAVYARPHSKEKAENFAEQYGIKEVYTDYEKLLNESGCDTVYIGLVNSAHYPYAKQALLHGKNVILEKPFTGDMDSTDELLDIALKNKLFIFEAVTVLHNPVINAMKENLDKLGKIKMFMANYSQYSSLYDDYLEGKVGHCFDEEYFGGALYDINVYNIHYAMKLFGLPNGLSYYPNRGFNGIDTSGTLVMNYPDFTAVCTGAKDSDSPGYVSVQGEKGWMRIEGKPNIADKVLVHYFVEGEKVRDAAGSWVRASKEIEFKAPEVHHRMTQEFEDFARIIDNKDYEAWEEYAGETSSVMEILTKAKYSGNTGLFVEIMSDFNGID